jgi:hypothetical protein
MGLRDLNSYRIKLVHDPEKAVLSEAIFRRQSRGKRVHGLAKMLDVIRLPDFSGQRLRYA